MVTPPNLFVFNHLWQVFTIWQSICNVLFSKQTMTTMKSLSKIFALSIMLSIAAAFMPEKASAQGGYVSFQVFYDQLSPYGRWVENPDYGYVWLPNAGPDFSPYSSNGYWVMTEYGWTWVSDYEWGWAPFHYGRWETDPYYGWYWVPDNEWGPAWVSWRRSPGYYGWAPLRPGISFEYAMRDDYRERDERYYFVEDRHFGRRDMNRYYGPRHDVSHLVSVSSSINNSSDDREHHHRFIAGPKREEVQKVTNAKVEELKIRESQKPEQKVVRNELNLYRPGIKANNDNGIKPAPQKVEKMQNRNEQNHPDNNPKRPEPNREQLPVVPQRPEPQQREQPKPVQPQKPEPQQREQPRPEQPQRPEPQQREQPSLVQPQRPEPQQREQPKPEQPQRPEPQQREQPRPVQPQRPEPQQREQPQRQQPAPVQPQRQAQPQRQEARPQPQRQQQAPRMEQPRPEPPRGNAEPGRRTE